MGDIKNYFLFFTEIGEIERNETEIIKAIRGH